MSDLLRELLSREIVMRLGVCFMLIGLLIAMLPYLLATRFGMRDTHASKLREAGQEEDAARLDRESASMRRSLTLCGRAMLVAGIVAVGLATLTRA